jgi:hypothetical protein
MPASTRDAGLVEFGEAGHALTAIGREPHLAFERMARWALRWWRQTRP